MTLDRKLIIQCLMALQNLRVTFEALTLAVDLPSNMLNSSSLLDPEIPLRLQLTLGMTPHREFCQQHWKRYMSDSIQAPVLMMQLEATNKRLLGDHVPSQLQVITDAHFAKLMALVETMRAAGVNEVLVRHSIHELVASYEAELVSVMTQLSHESQT